MIHDKKKKRKRTHRERERGKKNTPEERRKGFIIQNEKMQQVGNKGERKKSGKTVEPIS